MVHTPEAPAGSSNQFWIFIGVMATPAAVFVALVIVPPLAQTYSRKQRTTTGRAGASSVNRAEHQAAPGCRRPHRVGLFRDPHWRMRFFAAPRCSLSPTGPLIARYWTSAAVGANSRCTLARTIDVGLDVASRHVEGAHRGGVYARVLEADARQVPLPEGECGTVLSASALEHFSEPDAVLAEVYRVLRPGGVFVATVVLTDLHEQLFYPRLLRRIGLAPVARWYIKMQDRCFKHCTLLSKDTWEGMLRAQGFRLTVSERIVSPRLTRWWDMLLPLALPGHLVGRHLVWRPRWLARRLACWLEPLARTKQEQGSVLFFVAEKPVLAAPHVAFAGTAVPVALECSVVD